jgi:hypothetical protein
MAKSCPLRASRQVIREMHGSAVENQFGEHGGQSVTRTTGYQEALGTLQAEEPRFVHLGPLWDDLTG